MLLVPLSMFKPSSIFADRSKAFFVDLFCYNVVMFNVCLCYAVLSVPCSFLVTCLETAELLPLLYVVFVTFPYVS